MCSGLGRRYIERRHSADQEKDAAATRKRPAGSVARGAESPQSSDIDPTRIAGARARREKKRAQRKTASGQLSRAMAASVSSPSLVPPPESESRVAMRQEDSIAEDGEDGASDSSRSEERAAFPSSVGLRPCARPGCAKIEEHPQAFGTCMGCAELAYCSRVCQEVHWGVAHRSVCPGAALSGPAEPPPLQPLGGEEKLPVFPDDTDDAELPPPPPRIKLVLFDFDLTVLRKHTRGWFVGRVGDLVPFVSPVFLRLVPLLLRHQVAVGVVTFSDPLLGQSRGSDGVAGEPLVRAVLQLAFREFLARSQPGASLEERAAALVEHVHVAAAFPRLRNQQRERGCEPMPVSKAWHIEKIRDRLRLLGRNVSATEVMLFDDTKGNVKHALQSGVQAFLVDKARGFTRADWEAAVSTVCAKDDARAACS